MGEWIDAVKYPPEESGTYFILLEYNYCGERELIEDVGMYYNGKGNTRRPNPFWQAHPYHNRGFEPVNNVAYYMPCPEKPERW